MSSSSSDTLFQLRQSAILLLTAMIWGATFVAQSLGMDSVGPFTFTTTRMLLAPPVVNILEELFPASHGGGVHERPFEPVLTASSKK